MLRASSQLLLPLLTQHAVAGFSAPRQSTHAAALAGPRLGPPAPVDVVDALHSAATSAMATAQHGALLLWASGAPAALGCTLGGRVRFRWAPCVGWVQEGWRGGKDRAAWTDMQSSARCGAVGLRPFLWPPPPSRTNRRPPTEARRLSTTPQCLPASPLPTCSASALFQLCLAAALMRAAPVVCLAPALSSPPAQRLTHDLYAVVGLPSLALLGPSAARPSTHGQCVSILHFLQLALALVLPLAWQLASEVASASQMPCRPILAGQHSMPPTAGIPPAQPARLGMTGCPSSPPPPLRWRWPGKGLPSRPRTAEPADWPLGLPRLHDPTLPGGPEPGLAALLPRNYDPVAFTMALPVSTLPSSQPLCSF